MVLQAFFKDKACRIAFLKKMQPQTVAASPCGLKSLTSAFGMETCVSLLQISPGKQNHRTGLKILSLVEQRMVSLNVVRRHKNWRYDFSRRKNWGHDFSRVPV
jgi:hypothetical protein